MVENDPVPWIDILGLTRCAVKADLGNYKFVLQETYIGGVTRTGKPAKQIIELEEDLLNIIQNIGRFQAAGNALAGGVAGGIQGMVPDATVLALGEANPGLVDFVGGKMGEINKGLGNNPAKGATITLEYQCLTCICDEAFCWFKDDEIEWDDPDSQQQSYSIEANGRLVRFEDRQLVLYKTVSEIKAQDIADAEENARKLCEK